MVRDLQMRSFVRVLCTAIVLVAGFVMPSHAVAQPAAAGARLGGFVSGSLGDGGPASDVGLIAGYRFTPRWGVELDASYIPKLDFGEFPVCPPGVACLTNFRGGSFALTSRALSLTGHLVVQVPRPARWLQPYVLVGGGVARLTWKTRETFLPITSTTRETAWILSGGGGVEVPVWRGLALGVDLRYQRIVGEDVFRRPDIKQGLNLVRVGSLLSYRF